MDAIHNLITLNYCYDYDCDDDVHVHGDYDRGDCGCTRDDVHALFRSVSDYVNGGNENNLHAINHHAILS